jgi:hypothetical protein
LNGYAAGDAARVREQLQTTLDSGVKAEVIADNLISEIVANPQPIHLGLLDKLIDVSRSAYPAVKLLLALSGPATAPAFPVAPAPRPRAALATAPIPAAPAPAKAAELSSAPNPEPIPEPEKPKPQLIDTNQDSAEIWNQILLHVEQNAPSISKYLQDSDYVFADSKLTIYAKKKFIMLQINKKLSVIGEILPDSYTIEVNDQTLNKDAEMAAIAEIMGGGEEVHIDA